MERIFRNINRCNIVYVYMKFLLGGFIVVFILIVISNSVSAVLFTKGPFYVGDEITLEGQIECINEKYLEGRNIQYNTQIEVINKEYIDNFKPVDNPRLITPSPCENFLGTAYYID